MHQKIKFILDQFKSEDNKLEVIDLDNSWPGDLLANDLFELINFFKENPEYAKQIKNISIREMDLKDIDLDLDLSVFSHVEGIALKFCSLNKPPIFTGCKKVKKINLSFNQLTEVPNADNLKSLQILDITHNPLSASALVEAAAKTSKIRGGLQILTKSLRDRTHEIKIDTPSSFAPTYLQLFKMTELMSLFAQVVDTSMNLTDMSVVAIAFLNKIKHCKEIGDKELESMLNECYTNSRLQSQLKNIMLYCREFIDGAGAGGPINFFFDEEVMQNHIMSDDVWLPDWSFLSEMEQLQKPFGKQRVDESASFIIPKGMAAAMGFSFWQSDRDIPYLSPQEKKLFKFRFASESQPYILTRIFDKNNGRECTPDGKYIYGLSMHGGLTGTSVERYLEEQSITNHSAFRAGQYVACAGELQIKNGRIIDINYISGHMAPTAIQLFCAVAYLYARKYIDEKCTVTYCLDGVIMDHNKVVITVGELMANLDKYIKQAEVVKYIKEMQDRFEPESTNNIRLRINKG